MTEAPLYPFTIDKAKGRAMVHITGTLCAECIGRTFLAITLDPAWYGGERSIVWHLDEARIPESFSFGEIMLNAQKVKTLTRPGKSAIVVATDSPMGRAVAEFYRNLGESLTSRNLRVCRSLPEAHAWLDS